MNLLAASIRIGMIVGCLWGSIGRVHGEEMIMELIALKDKRDAAVEKAVSVIDVTYRRELEKLLARAVSDGDRENSERIRAEIQLIGKPGGAVVGKNPGGDGELEKLLLNKSWEWFSPDEKLVSYGTLTFLKSGEVERPGALGFIKSWKMAGENRFEVIQGGGNRWLFEYDPEEKIALSIKMPGYIGDNKKLVPVL